MGLAAGIFFLSGQEAETANGIIFARFPVEQAPIQFVKKNLKLAMLWKTKPPDSPTKIKLYKSLVNTALWTVRAGC